MIEHTTTPLLATPRQDSAQNEWSFYEHPRQPPEENQFTRAAGGWVFATQRLWLIGETTYLVNYPKRCSCWSVSYGRKLVTG